MGSIHHPHAALVARTPAFPADHGRYLKVSDGYDVWIDDPAAATIYPSMREAARAALRLPSDLHAFGLLRQPELAAHQITVPAPRIDLDQGAGAPLR